MSGYLATVSFVELIPNMAQKVVFTGCKFDIETIAYLHTDLHLHVGDMVTVLREDRRIEKDGKQYQIHIIE